MGIQGPNLRFRFSNGQDESNCVLLDGEQDTNSILVSTKNTEDTQTVCVHIFYGLLIGRAPDSRPEVAGSNLAYNQPTSGCQRLSGMQGILKVQEGKEDDEISVLCIE